DCARAPLAADLHPGDSTVVRAVFRAPTEPGMYLLKVDLVEEGVTWFEPAGSKAEMQPIEIAADERRE
ncbi:MAG TPA: hypothetical protein VH138_00995, partial [Vicinamibacterales bacterium]|nr:hypothetical protein [Vicinamibacterales bacterium]